MAYISVINFLHMLQITILFHDIDHLWAALRPRKLILFNYEWHMPLAVLTNVFYIMLGILMSGIMHALTVARGSNAKTN
jgi:hypothetical protein